MQKAQIHFFSATGNSELAAKIVSAGLKQAQWDVELKNIRDLKNNEEFGKCTISNFVGFVFPIFAFRAAIPMEQHIINLPPSPRPKAVFLVATYAGYLDRTFMRLRDFLLPKNYFPVSTTTLLCADAWTAVRFPGHIYDQGMPYLKSQENLRDFACNELPEVWAKNRKSPVSNVGWVPYNPISLIAATFPIAIRKGKQFPIFVKKSSCTRCGKCVKQCPTGRLKLSPYPKPQGNCVGCYGCINSCPNDAINTWFTNGQVRYRGPEQRLY
ncbi:MAG: EFR1 family ferrodoxin [Candidatus Riflebacteria bacterium]|nr:EFR1 family ferrodoxin [Candidatus Riflebacteria bacterium]